MKYLFLLVPLVFIIGCAESVETPAVGDADMVQMLNVPGSAIDVDRLNSHLSTFGIEVPGSFLDPRDKTLVSENIDKLRLALDEAIEEGDDILIFAMYGMLGNQYKELGFFHNDTAALEEAEKYTRKALEVSKEKLKLKADAALAKSNLSLIYMYQGKSDKAFDIYTGLIENYQDIGIGDYPQWFAVQNTLYLSGTAMRYTQGDYSHPYMKKVVEHLEKLSESYENEIGVTAAIELFSYYIRTGKYDEANDLKNIIETRLEHIEHDHIKTRWARIATRAEQLQAIGR